MEIDKPDPKIMQAFVSQMELIIEDNQSGENLEAIVKKGPKELEEARKRLEETLKERTRELKEAKTFSEEILESIKDPLIIVDLNGNMLSSNKAFADRRTHHEFDINEYIVKPASEAPNISSGDLKKYTKLMEEVVETGFAGPIETRSVLKDGSEKYQNITASLLKNAQGEPIAVFIMLRDVTDTKKLISELSDFREATIYMLGDLDRTSKELAESKDYVDNIIRSMIDTLIVVSPEGNIKTVNNALLNLLGYKEEELIGKPVATIFAAEEEIPFKGMKLEKVIKEGELKDYETNYKAKDGKKIPILLSFSVVKDKDDNITYIDCTAKDITELKRASEGLKQAKAAAENANKAKSEFLANMSHELRTPLNHIIGFTELIVGKNFGDLNKTQEKYLDNVLQSGRYLLSLISDILDLSKLEEGKLELKPSDVNLKMLLENSLIIVKDKAMKHSIHLSLSIDNIPEIVRADERKIKQIIYNLLSNAVKSTLDGGEVCLSARMVDYMVRADRRKGGLEDLQIIKDRISGSEVEGWKRRKCIEFSVSDTGVGIRQEYQKRIFDRFERTDGSSSRMYQGAGLGLYLAKRFVELHGGRIWVESAGEGQGSRFIFIIPI